MTDQQIQQGQGQQGQQGQGQSTPPPIPTPPTPPVQDTKPVQNEGVFGGNPQEALNDPSMFGPLENNESATKEAKVEVDETPTLENNVATEEKTNEEKASSPFDGYQLPQETEKTNKEETKVEENTIETPVIKDEEVVVDTKELEETQENEEKVSNETMEEPKVEISEESKLDEPENKIEEVEKEPVEEKEISDIQQKFLNLSENITEINSIIKSKDGDILEIVGANNDNFSVLYQFVINEQKEIQVKRIETKKDNDETLFNELKLCIDPESNLFQIFLDNVLLFDESDLIDDNKKRSQVMEKINKLIFLTESKLKDVQKEIRAKQEENEERKRLQDIFRNF